MEELSPLEQRKAEIELRRKDARKIALCKAMYRHLIGFFLACVELYLGYKPNLRE